MKTKTSSYRLQYLDWARGLGAIIMLQGHVFDSFLRSDLRGGSAYMFSQFVGGMPPAIFLFLTGVTYAFLMDSVSRRPLSGRERIWEALRRAGYLFTLAFAFRLQLWIFGTPAPWQDLFKVDVLNCMGFAMAVMSLAALATTQQRIRICGAVGLVAAFGAPLVSMMDWSVVPWMFRAYLVPDFRYFGFFPWGAFLCFGMSAGSILRVTPPETTERAMQWGALAGGAMILACQYFSNLPWSLYPKTEYWLNSPALILTKLGITLVMLAFAYVWTRYGAKDSWSWVRQFGVTSLLVYWVHIELVYGKGLGFLKGGLDVPQTVIAAAMMILLMLGLSVVRTNWVRVKSWLADVGWGWGPRAGSAEGD